MDNLSKLRIVETSFYIVDLAKRSWRERLFSWPWQPWVDSHPVNIPSIVKLGNDIYCHSTLLPLAQRMLEQCKNAGDECGQCEWTWNSATSNGLCEFCEKRQWFDEFSPAQ